MQYLIRLRDWWLNQFRATSRLGKVAMLIVPLLFGCCALTTCSVLFSPSAADPAPSPAAVDRAATVEVAAVEPTAEPTIAQPTEEPLPPDTAAPPATATLRPTNTPRPTASTTASSTPTATAAPARVSTVNAATALFATAAAQPTAVPQPTAAPPTSTSAPAPTAAPTAVPTQAPLPTDTLPPVAAPGDVYISSIFYNGVVEQVESDEYAVITNRGAAVVNLAGWRLNAGEPDQNFYFPSFDLQPGQSCRVYTNEAHPESCGLSFGIGSAIWRNSGDCGTLHDATGAEVSRYYW